MPALETCTNLLILHLVSLFLFAFPGVIIIFYVCQFDDATNMRYRGVRRQGKGMCRFIIATVGLFPALDDRTGRTDVSRLPCVMIYFLVVVDSG
jgi:hypothetical protein